MWTRQRQVNQLRSLLRECYPGALTAFGTDLGSRDALAVLQVAPTPARGRGLAQAKLAAVLRRAGRQRGLEGRAAKLQAALRAPQLPAPPMVAEASGAAVTALVGVIAALNVQLEQLSGQLQRHFEQHPDAEIVASQPGLGVILGARVVAALGDDPTRYPILRPARTTPAPPRSPARPATARSWSRGWPATGGWPMPLPVGVLCLTASPGARADDDRCRAAGKTHQQALRALANRLVGILHGCLRHRTLDNELHARPTATQKAA